MSVYLDTNLAHNIRTRRSIKGIKIMLNITPVQWYSKRQATVETSNFWLDLLSARIATELTITIQNKLRMQSSPVDGEVLLLGDNFRVVTNCSILLSTLKNKHNSIVYHRVREAVSAGIICLVDV